MLSFERSETQINGRQVEASWLVTPVEELEAVAHTDGILVDGERVDLPEATVGALASATVTCEELATAGAAADCSVFGVLAMGGSYEPVDDLTYRIGLSRHVLYANWLGEEVLSSAPEEMTLVQFIMASHRGMEPRHTAVQLPGRPNTFIQKLGEGLPVAVMDVESACLLYCTNAVAKVNSFRAHHNGYPVLTYHDPTPVPGDQKAWSYLSDHEGFD